jgi:WD40 repeat protein
MLQCENSVLLAGSEEGSIAVWALSYSTASSRVSRPVCITTVVFPSPFDLVLRVPFQVIAQLCFRRKENDLGELRCVAVSPVNGGIALGWSSAVVQLWTRKPAAGSGLSALRGLPTYCEAKGLKGHADSVTAVKFSDAGLLFTACVDGRLKIWDAVGAHIGRCVRTVVVSDSGVKCLKLLPSRWFVGCMDGSVHSRECGVVYWKWFRTDAGLFVSVLDFVAALQLNRTLPLVLLCTSRHHRCVLVANPLGCVSCSMFRISFWLCFGLQRFTRVHFGGDGGFRIGAVTRCVVVFVGCFLLPCL